MKRQTVYVLGVIFAVLVALVGLTRWWMARPTQPAKAPFDLAQVTEKDVDRIVIASSATTTTLTKSSGVWRIGAPAAAATSSPARITALFTGLGKARFERLVTEKPADPSAYGLAAGTGTTVTVYSGGTQRVAFRIGSPADVPGSDYVQAPPGSSVWVVSGGLKGLFDPSPAYWRTPPTAPATSSPPPAAPSPPPTGP